MVQDRVQLGKSIRRAKSLAIVLLNIAIDFTLSMIFLTLGAFLLWQLYQFTKHGHPVLVFILFAVLAVGLSSVMGLMFNQEDRTTLQ